MLGSAVGGDHRHRSSGSLDDASSLADSALHTLTPLLNAFPVPLSPPPSQLRRLPSPTPRPQLPLPRTAPAPPHTSSIHQLPRPSAGPQDVPTDEVDPCMSEPFLTPAERVPRLAERRRSAGLKELVLVSAKRDSFSSTRSPYLDGPGSLSPSMSPRIPAPSSPLSPGRTSRHLSRRSPSSSTRPPPLAASDADADQPLLGIEAPEPTRHAPLNAPDRHPSLDSAGSKPAGAGAPLTRPSAPSLSAAESAHSAKNSEAVGGPRRSPEGSSARARSASPLQRSPSQPRSNVYASGSSTPTSTRTLPWGSMPLDPTLSPYRGTFEFDEPSDDSFISPRSNRIPAKPCSNVSLPPLPPSLFPPDAKPRTPAAFGDHAPHQTEGPDSLESLENQFDLDFVAWDHFTQSGARPVHHLPHEPGLISGLTVPSTLVPPNPRTSDASVFSSPSFVSDILQDDQGAQHQQDLARLLQSRLPSNQPSTPNSASPSTGNNQLSIQDLPHLDKNKVASSSSPASQASGPLFSEGAHELPLTLPPSTVPSGMVQTFHSARSSHSDMHSPNSVQTMLHQDPLRIPHSVMGIPPSGTQSLSRVGLGLALGSQEKDQAPMGTNGTTSLYPLMPNNKREPRHTASPSETPVLPFGKTQRELRTSPLKVRPVTERSWPGYETRPVLHFEKSATSSKSFSVPSTPRDIPHIRAVSRNPAHTFINAGQDLTHYIPAGASGPSTPKGTWSSRARTIFSLTDENDNSSPADDQAHLSLTASTTGSHGQRRDTDNTTMESAFAANDGATIPNTHTDDSASQQRYPTQSLQNKAPEVQAVPQQSSAFFPRSPPTSASASAAAPNSTKTGTLQLPTKGRVDAQTSLPIPDETNLESKGSLSCDNDLAKEIERQRALLGQQTKEIQNLRRAIASLTSEFDLHTNSMRSHSRTSEWRRSRSSHTGHYRTGSTRSQSERRQADLISSPSSEDGADSFEEEVHRPRSQRHYHRSSQGSSRRRDDTHHDARTTNTRSKPRHRERDFEGEADRHSSRYFFDSPTDGPSKDAPLLTPVSHHRANLSPDALRSPMADHTSPGQSAHHKPGAPQNAHDQKSVHGSPSAGNTDPSGDNRDWLMSPPSWAKRFGPSTPPAHANELPRSRSSPIRARSPCRSRRDRERDDKEELDDEAVRPRPRRHRSCASSSRTPELDSSQVASSPRYKTGHLAPSVTESEPATPFPHQSPHMLDSPILGQGNLRQVGQKLPNMRQRVRSEPQFSPQTWQTQPPTDPVPPLPTWPDIYPRTFPGQFGYAIADPATLAQYRNSMQDSTRRPSLSDMQAGDHLSTSMQASASAPFHQPVFVAPGPPYYLSPSGPVYVLPDRSPQPISASARTANKLANSQISLHATSTQPSKGRKSCFGNLWGRGHKIKTFCFGKPDDGDVYRPTRTNSAPPAAHRHSEKAESVSALPTMGSGLGLTSDSGVGHTAPDYQQEVRTPLPQRVSYGSSQAAFGQPAEWESGPQPGEILHAKVREQPVFTPPQAPRPQAPPSTQALTSAQNEAPAHVSPPTVSTAAGPHASMTLSASPSANKSDSASPPSCEPNSRSTGRKKADTVLRRVRSFTAKTFTARTLRPPQPTEVEPTPPSSPAAPTGWTKSLNSENVGVSSAQAPHSDSASVPVSTQSEALPRRLRSDGLPHPMPILNGPISTSPAFEHETLTRLSFGPESIDTTGFNPYSDPADSSSSDRVGVAFSPAARTSPVAHPQKLPSVPSVHSVASPWGGGASFHHPYHPSRAKSDMPPHPAPTPGGRQRTVPPRPAAPAVGLGDLGSLYPAAFPPHTSMTLPSDPSQFSPQRTVQEASQWRPRADAPSFPEQVGSRRGNLSHVPPSLTLSNQTSWPQGSIPRTNAPTPSAVMNLPLSPPRQGRGHMFPVRASIASQDSAPTDLDDLVHVIGRPENLRLGPS